MTSANASRSGGTHQVKKATASGWIGSVLEYYDFFIYATAASLIFPRLFFPAGDPQTAIVASLATYGVGYVARPIGACVLGHWGDTHGRKNVLILCMFLMGLSTMAVGLLPTYDQVGLLAPTLLVVLRLIQGLAIGGEYGGAAIYVAEHAPDGKRGFFTSFIQTNSTLGLFAALLMVICLRATMDPARFAEWGWRIPFLLSSVLLAVSMWIRLQLSESPVFQRMKDEGRTSRAPLTEAFGTWRNLRWALVALLGGVAGQAVIWYTAQFYALFYLERILKVDGETTNILIAVSLLIGTPLYLLFGWLSDRLGRKSVIMAGMALGLVTIYPLFGALTHAANPGLADATAKSPVTVSADPATCSFQFDPIGRNTFDKTGCDVAKSALAKAGIPYVNRALPAGSDAAVRVGAFALPALAGTLPPKDQATAFRGALAKQLLVAGYPEKADPARLNRLLVVAILVGLLVPVTMTYGPIAALLVELFPSRIRYTALSLPYHIGNGWFGGFLPTIAFALVAATGDIYAGLWYTLAVAGMTLVIGLIFLPETFRRHIEHEY